MDISHIRYFLAVAEEESFSRAAEKLFVTQPILTRCIKNLEQELGTTLITRTTKTFALTEAGKVLQQAGRKLLQQHEDIYRQMADIRSGAGGEVQISSPGVLLNMYFTELVLQCRDRYPGVRINISEVGSHTAARDVRSGAADIGFVMLPLEDTEDLNVYPIVKDQIKVVCRKDHPFANQKGLSVLELKQANIVTHNSSTTLHELFLRMCAQNGFSPNIVCQSQMPNFIFDMIGKNTDVVGILPGPMLHLEQARDLTGIPLKPEFPWQIAMITSKGRYLSNAAARFLDFSLEFFS